MAFTGLHSLQCKVTAVMQTRTQLRSRSIGEHSRLRFDIAVFFRGTRHFSIWRCAFLYTFFPIFGETEPQAQFKGYIF